MNEMIERVARAIYYASDFQRLAGKDPYAGDPTGQAFARDMARAAIAAMREPTSEMKLAAHDIIHDLDLRFAPFSEADRGAEQAWQAMIDAALEGNDRPS